METVSHRLAATPSPAQDAPCVRCTGVSVNFFQADRSVTAIEHLTLEVPRGEFLTLLGPSGCGKSTLLRLVAGLIQPSEGSIEVLGTTPAAARKRRSIGFVFQDAALLAWRTAIENVSLPTEVSQEVALERYERSAQVLELKGLGARLHAYPHQLSGGMRQRVSIARALVSRPELLLMDEPFGALDEITRDRLNEELRRIWKETGVTILFVTHGVYEAAYLGQRVLVLAANPGRIREIVPVLLPEDRTIRIRETPDFAALAAYLRNRMEVAG